MKLIDADGKVICECDVISNPTCVNSSFCAYCNLNPNRKDEENHAV